MSKNTLFQSAISAPLPHLTTGTIQNNHLLTYLLQVTCLFIRRRVRTC